MTLAEERARREREIWGAYDRAIGPAREVYCRDTESAQEDYTRATKPAREALDRALAELEAEP